MNLSQTVWNPNLKLGKFQFSNWGRLEIPKLLLIFQNNLKNSQHESCSTFQALPLSCWSFFKIPNRFWIRDSNWKKGTLSGNLYFQNYFEFCIETSKTQNTKVVHLDKIYNFAFELNFKLCLVFELHKRGQIQGFKIRVPPLNFSENYHPRFLNSKQASIHKINTL